MEREVSPFADPSLPKYARFTMAVLCLAAVGALSWALWLLWVNTQHPCSWFSTLPMGCYFGWVIWSKWCKASTTR
jgi:hypothetical protein